MSCTTMTFGDANCSKGFGRGWGHPRSHKKNDKVRMPQKPERKKNYKLKRDSKNYTDSQLLGASYYEVVIIELMKESPMWEDDRSDWGFYESQSERDEEERMSTFLWFGLLI